MGRPLGQSAARGIGTSAAHGNDVAGTGPGFAAPPGIWRYVRAVGCAETGDRCVNQGAGNATVRAGRWAGREVETRPRCFQRLADRLAFATGEADLREGLERAHPPRPRVRATTFLLIAYT